MEKEKIVFEYCFEKADFTSGSLGTLSFTYGYPVVVGNVVDIDEIGSEALDIRSNEFRSTFEQYIINFLEQKYPDALILSKEKYAVSMNVGTVSIDKLAKGWRRRFRKEKIRKFFKKLFPYKVVIVRR